MEEPIKLTIFVAVFNHEKYIKKALDSIVNQVCGFSTEIICIDDGSTDRSSEIIHEICKERVILLKRKKNCGLTRNMYYAYTHARGEYFISVAGDDWLLNKNAFQMMVDFLDAHDEYASVSYATDIFSKFEKKIGEIRSSNLSFKLEDYLKGNEPGCYAGMTRTKSMLANQNLSCLYKASRNNEEIVHWIMRLESGPMYVLPDVLYAYRYVSSGKSNYNSTHTAKDVFIDNWKTIKYVESHYVPLYNLNMLKGNKIKRFLDSLHGKEGIKDGVWGLRAVGIDGLRCLLLYCFRN